MKEIRQDDSLNRILKKATRPSAPIDLQDKVLSAWKAEALISKTLKPLIPKWVWWSVIPTLVIAIGWVIFNSPSEGGIILNSSLIDKLSFTFEIPSFFASPIMIMSLLAFCLMLFVNVLFHSIKVIE